MTVLASSFSHIALDLRPGGLGVGLGEVDLDHLADAHLADAGEAERAERVPHRLALRVEHAGLQRHMHPRLHQFTSFGPTWVRPLVRGMTPSRLATSV